MTFNLVAKASASIHAPVTSIWHALLDPDTIKRYMFGSTVTSQWQVGSPITWEGEYKGRAYKDHGVILNLEKGKQLKYTHFSPLGGKPDLPENYHTVTIDLVTKGAATVLTLSQDKNTTEEARQESQKNWLSMLEGLKKIVEA